MSVPKPRVVVVEDEPDLNATMVSFLNLSGFVADGVRSAAELEAWLRTHDCDLAVLDLGLPDRSGLSLVEALRDGGRCGVVMVTARGQLDDKLKAYATGADHYLIKPVDLRELVAVLSTLRERLPPKALPWDLHALTWQITAPSGRSARLTKSELAVLTSLAASPGNSVPRAAIAEALGFHMADYDPRRMEIMIRRLRKKIAEETGLPAPIETVHGQGYAFTAAIRVS